jgi:hypothetical protein
MIPMASLLSREAIEQIKRLFRSEARRLKMIEAPRARYTRRGGGGTCNIQRRYVCSGGNLIEQWRYCYDTTWTTSSVTPPPDD